MMPIESKIVLETGFQHVIASYIQLAIHSDYVVMDKYLKPQETIEIQIKYLAQKMKYQIQKGTKNKKLKGLAYITAS